MDMSTNEIFGSRAIIEAIKSNTQIEKIFILKDAENELSKELFSLIKDHKITFQYVPIQKFRKFDDKNHQGVFAKIALINTITIDELFKQIDLKGSTFLLNIPPSNSAERWLACAALPPLPHQKIVFEFLSLLTIKFAESSITNSKSLLIFLNTSLWF